MDRDKHGQFVAGHKGFRPKGSRNRFTTAMLMKLMEENENGLAFHPMKEAIDLYRTTEDDKIKVMLLKELLSFGNNKQFIEEKEDGTVLEQAPSNEAIEALGSAFQQFVDKETHSSSEG